MSSDDIKRQMQLASRAKTKVKKQGHRGICDLSFDEISALAFIADLFLVDYEGPLIRGDPDPDQPPPTQTENTQEGDTICPIPLTTPT